MKNNMIWGIIAASILGVAIYSNYNNKIDLKNVKELLILEDKYPAAAQDIVNGKRYDTKIKHQEGDRANINTERVELKNI